MESYQHDFIRFAVEAGVLRFGEFQLKSGRISPYFFNAGLFNTGGRLAALGDFYARALKAQGAEFDMLFGPAYKGIPLATGLAMALSHQYGQDVPYAFNRKEAKDHGEGGQLIGAPLSGRVLIVDDVISAGTSVRESIAAIRSASAQVAGVVIALDRQERGQGERSAIAELTEEQGIPVYSICRLDDLQAYLEQQGFDQELIERMAAYRRRYGA